MTAHTAVEIIEGMIEAFIKCDTTTSDSEQELRERLRAAALVLWRMSREATKGQIEAATTAIHNERVINVHIPDQARKAICAAQDARIAEVEELGDG